MKFVKTLISLLLLMTTHVFAEDKIKIGLIVPNGTNPFFRDLTAGASGYAKANRIELIKKNSNLNPSLELENINYMVENGVDAIVIGYVNSSIGIHIESIIKNSPKPIKVIAVDRPFDKDSEYEPDATVTSDNFKGGQLAGEFVLKVLKNQKINVLIIQEEIGSANNTDRVHGFRSVIDDNKNMDLVSIIATSSDGRGVRKSVSSVIASGIEFDAVLAYNDLIADQAIRTLRNHGKKSVVVGFDGYGNVIHNHTNDIITASIKQKPYEMGQVATEYAKKLILGEPVEEKTKLLDVSLITEYKFNENNK